MPAVDLGSDHGDDRAGSQEAFDLAQRDSAAPDDEAAPPRNLQHHLVRRHDGQAPDADAHGAQAREEIVSMSTPSTSRR